VCCFGGRWVEEFPCLAISGLKFAEKTEVSYQDIAFSDAIDFEDQTPPQGLDIENRVFQQRV
jgi:hypothetical protein